MGAKKQTNGRAGRRQRMQAPPCGHHSGKVSRRPAGQAAPAGTCLAETVSAASGLMQGCRGRSPRRNKVIFSPFPAGRGGRGDGGRKQSERQGRQATRKASPPADSGTARSAGDQPGKPPCGHHSGKVSRQPTGQAAKNHSSASSSRKAVTKPRAAASSDASAKIRRRGSVPENRQITKELSVK